MDLKIGIVGQGFVGTALKEIFNKYYITHTFDIKDLTNEIGYDSAKDLSVDCDICFVCVPTPMNKDGSCNTLIVEKVVEELCSVNDKNIIVIKSTVPPTTTKKLQERYKNPICFNPEFLVERTAIKDFENTDTVILGGVLDATTKLKQFYSKIFPNAHIIKTDSTTAELVKYLVNTFLSVKVSFANEIHNICQQLSVDYDKVIEYSIYDNRLGNSHWAVPGPDGKFGFGGSCFPKDVNALIKVAEDLSIKVPTLQGAWDTNLQVRPEKDWEKLKGRAVV